MKASRSTLILISSISVFALFPVVSALAQKSGRPGKSVIDKNTIVGKIEFAGVRSFPQSDIKKLLLTKENHWYNIFNKRRLSKSSVAADVGTIKRFYGRRGFLFTTVRDSMVVASGNNKAAVIFIVVEGQRTTLSGVSIMGGLKEINGKFDKTLSQFVVGEPINAIRAISGRFILRDIYSDYGYPYARIDNDLALNPDSGQADIMYAVEESLYTVNGKTSIVKTGNTRSGVVLRELVVKPGKGYSRKDILESEQRLYSTGLFKLVNLRRDDSSAETNNDTCRVDFLLSYEERKALFVNGGIGVGREDYFGVVFRLPVQFGHRNLFGTSRKLIVGARPVYQITDPEGPLKSFNPKDLMRKLKLKFIRTTFELNYIEPWLLNYRIPASLRLIYEPYTLKPIFEWRYDRVAGEMTFSRELDRNTIARLNSTIEYLNIRNVPADQQEFYREEGDNQIRRKISLYGERDTRDNIFVPQHGSYSFMGLDYVGGILGGDFTYVKAQFSWSRYQSIMGNNILATRIWAGGLDDLGREGRSSSEDRFFLGGATTVRGFTENRLGPVFVEADDPGDRLGKPKGGRYLLLGNLELRRSLFWRFGGTVFLDAGNTYSYFEDITPISIAFSSGLGMQFFTPIGPLRFDYGIRLKKEFDLGAGSYHLSILYAF